MLSICEAELEEVYGQERDQHQTGRRAMEAFGANSEDFHPVEQPL